MNITTKEVISARADLAAAVRYRDIAAAAYRNLRRAKPSEVKEKYDHLRLMNDGVMRAQARLAAVSQGGESVVVHTEKPAWMSMIREMVDGNPDRLDLFHALKAALKVEVPPSALERFYGHDAVWSLYKDVDRCEVIVETLVSPDDWQEPFHVYVGPTATLHW